MIQDGAFLPDRPENLAKNATLVPTIFGVNDKEGILLFIGKRMIFYGKSRVGIHLYSFCFAISDMNRNLVQKVHDDFSIIVTNNFKVDSDAVPELSAKIKRFYFEDEDVGLNNADRLVDVNIA